VLGEGRFQAHGRVEAAFCKSCLYSALELRIQADTEPEVDCLTSLSRLMCRTLITCACLLTAHRMPLLPRIEGSLLTRWFTRNSWDGKSRQAESKPYSHGFETLSFVFLLCFPTSLLSGVCVRKSAFRGLWLNGLKSIPPPVRGTEYFPQADCGAVMHSGTQQLVFLLRRVLFDLLTVLMSSSQPPGRAGSSSRGNVANHPSVRSVAHFVARCLGG
jgi:hypothetical protein